MDATCPTCGRLCGNPRKRRERTDLNGISGVGNDIKFEVGMTGFAYVCGRDIKGREESKEMSTLAPQSGVHSGTFIFVFGCIIFLLSLLRKRILWAASGFVVGEGEGSHIQKGRISEGERYCAQLLKCWAEKICGGGLGNASFPLLSSTPDPPYNCRSGNLLVSVT